MTPGAAPCPGLPPDRTATPGRQCIVRTLGVGVYLLLLAFFQPAPGAAQTWEAYDYEDLEFRGVGIEAGRIYPTNVDPTNYFGIRADLGFVGPRIRIIPSARYWSSEMQTAELHRLAEQIILVCERQGGLTCPEELDLGQVSRSDLELSVDAHYTFLTNRTFSPFLGASLGLHLLNGRGDFIDGTFIEDLLDTVSPGVGPLMGLNVRLGSSLQLAAEARFVLASDLRYIGFGANLLWTLPTASEN